MHPSMYRTEEGNVPDYKGIHVRLSNEVKCDPKQYKIIMEAIDPILECIDEKVGLSPCMLRALDPMKQPIDERAPPGIWQSDGCSTGHPSTWKRFRTSAHDRSRRELQLCHGGAPRLQ